MKTGIKIGASIGLVLALYMFPDVKSAYDNLYISAAASRTVFSAFDAIALRILPLLVVGAIIYGIISAVFKRRSA